MDSSLYIPIVRWATWESIDGDGDGKRNQSAREIMHRRVQQMFAAQREGHHCPTPEERMELLGIQPRVQQSYADFATPKSGLHRRHPRALGRIIDPKEMSAQLTVIVLVLLCSNILLPV